MTGREKIAKLVAEMRAEQVTMAADIAKLAFQCEMRRVLADKLEAMSAERSDEQCDLAAEHISDAVLN